MFIITGYYKNIEVTIDIQLQNFDHLIHALPEDLIQVKHNEDSFLVEKKNLLDFKIHEGFVDDW
jgi:hypothetical protein